MNHGVVVAAVSISRLTLIFDGLNRLLEQETGVEVGSTASNQKTSLVKKQSLFVA